MNSEISGAWQACLEEMWTAFCHGSVPVGAVFTDGTDAIVCRRRNRLNETDAPLPHMAGTRLGHAEMNVLVQIPTNSYPNMGEGVLYTTLEPCPMCTGALVMSGVRHVRYGARDPEWGAMGLLTRAPLSRRAIRVEGPHPVIEIASLALSIVRFVDRPTPRSSDFIRAFSKTSPIAGELAQQWLASGSLAHAVERGAPVEEVMEAVWAAL